MNTTNEPQLLFYARPSMRRALFFAMLYSGAVLYGRLKTDLDPRFNQVWWGCFGLLVILLCFAFLRRWTTTYAINSNEARCVSGILARQGVVAPLLSISNANVNQSFLERLLGLANLQLDTPGGSTREITFARILKSQALAAANVIREHGKWAAESKANSANVA